MHDSVRLCSDRGQVLATYPAEKLAFSACCPDDRRFFGLVTMQATDDHDDCHFSNGRDEEGGLRTSCHVFIVDPELCLHQVWINTIKGLWLKKIAVPFITISAENLFIIRSLEHDYVLGILFSTIFSITAGNSKTSAVPKCSTSDLPGAFFKDVLKAVQEKTL